MLEEFRSNSELRQFVETTTDRVDGIETAERFRSDRRVLKSGGTASFMAINRHSWLYFPHRVARVTVDCLDSPVFARFDYKHFAAFAAFDHCEIFVERFPVRTEVHKGLKSMLYNSLFVDLYNALPSSQTRRTGYRRLAFATKSG